MKRHTINPDDLDTALDDAQDIVQHRLPAGVHGYSHGHMERHAARLWMMYLPTGDPVARIECREDTRERVGR